MYRGLGPVLASLGVSNFVYFYSNNLLKVVVKRMTKEKVSILPYQKFTNARLLYCKI